MHMLHSPDCSSQPGIFGGWAVIAIPVCLMAEHWCALLMCSYWCFSLQIAAVELAEETHTPVKHPLLDQVRKYTSTPEAAAAFFIAVLHPTPRARLTSLQALNHPYLKQCVQQMQDFYHPPPSDPPRSRLDILASAPLPDTPSSGSLLHTLGSASKWVLEASIC